MSAEHMLTLRRESARPAPWNWLGNGGLVNWIMLNPSTADEHADDPTIRKCVGFSRRWGFSSLVVTNLFAFRATDPKYLHLLLAQGHLDRAVGHGNDDAISDAAAESDMVVVAWGSNAGRALVARRVEEVRQILKRRSVLPHCIGMTNGGHPLHPCKAAYTDRPLPWLVTLERGA